MVYIPSWQEFQEAAENLYEKSPNSVSLQSSDLSLSLVLITADADTVLCKMEVIRGKAGLEDNR